MQDSVLTRFYMFGLECSCQIFAFSSYVLNCVFSLVLIKLTHLQIGPYTEPLFLELTVLNLWRGIPLGEYWYLELQKYQC